MRTFQRSLRTISIVTLFFFVWTFLPLFQLAAYGAESHKASGKRSEGAAQTAKTQPQTTGDRFEKALDAIRENVAKAWDKADKGEDDAKELAAIKANKATIDSADGEFRTEFAATEKKLKDAKLPKEILARHDSFVKQYDDNLKELKANLDDIDQATTKSDRKAKIEKARLHLDKTKKPSMHQKLDPNNLPFMARKAGKTREPRLKKEDFDEDFPLQKSLKSTRTADLEKFYNSAIRNSSFALQHRPILIAFSEPMSDMPLQLPRPLSERTEVRGGFGIPQIAFSDSAPILLAQAVNTPSSDDLAETTEIQFTADIKAKAAELGYNPVKIYEWVRNNINYQPYYGSLKGAQQTLAESSGNDFDQASLLIALLRVSQIEARYTYGTVEIPIEKVMNWVGGVSDPKVAGMILSSKGIPAKLLTSGGVIKKIQIEHVWVEAWIDYFPSWGASHKTGQGDTWIPLDPSFKQYTYNPGMDMYSLMGFNGDQFLQSYITDTRDITAYQTFGMQLVDFIDTNYPDASINDVFGASEMSQIKTITIQEFPYLLGTLSYSVKIKASQFSAVPASNTYTVAIDITDSQMSGEIGTSYASGMQSLSDKRVTVSYEPATSSDAMLVSQYGGNMLDVPPYLINVKPTIRVDGAVVATGGTIGLGYAQNITITFTSSAGDIDRIQNVINAGDYAAVILQPQGTPIETVSAQISKLLSIDTDSMTLDNVLGQLLYSIGLSYFQKIRFESEVYAQNLQVANYYQPAEAMISHKIKVDYLFGIPRSASEGGISVDVDRNINAVYPSEQNGERKKAFLILSGLSSSAWEDRILNAFFDVSAVSAVRLLKEAANQGISIYTLSSSNTNTIMPLLQIDSAVKTDIANAVNAGNNVIVSKNEIVLGTWSGVGYIVMDPVSGAASYMISGGLSGGDCDYLPLKVREKPEFVAEYWKTIALRQKALAVARAYKGTPYVYDGKILNNDIGLDCSGLVHAAYEGSDLPIGNAAYQYEICGDNEWLRPFDERMPGDIVWKSGLGHVGISGGKNTLNWPPNAATQLNVETVVHASGRPCGGPNSCIPDNQCYGGNPPCGKFNRVIESPLASSPSSTSLGISYFGTPLNEVGRPQ